MGLEKMKIQAIFPHDKDTLDMLWNRYINKIFKCWEYENGRLQLEYINYETLNCPFNVIKFGDMVYIADYDGTTDCMAFNPPNCPYWFEHSFIAKEYLKKDYSHYAITTLSRDFDFEKFVKSKEGGKMLSQFAFESTMLYLMILYMNEKPDYIQSDDVPSWKAKQSDKNDGNKNDYKYTKVVKKYLVSKNMEKRPHGEIQCPVWSVRGHYRHYKNGNVVFIKSYNKGKDRNKKDAEEKIYKIDKNKIAEGL